MIHISCQVHNKQQAISLSSSWAVIKEYLLSITWTQHYTWHYSSWQYGPGARATEPYSWWPVINILIFPLTTWQTSWTQSQRNLQFSRETWYLLWQFHIALSQRQTKSWSFIFTRLSWDQALWWKEITGNPSLGLEVSEAKTRHTYPALWSSGKIPSHRCPHPPASCCPPVSSVSVSADPQHCVCLGGQEEWQRASWWRLPRALADLIRLGLVSEMLHHCSCLAPKPLPF